jgi:hypothetical protein
MAIVKSLVLVLCTWALAATVQAATLNPADLPTAVQSCLGAGKCSVDTTSSFDQTVPGSAGISGYKWIDARSGTPVSKYLVRYSLLAASSNVYTGVDATGALMPTQTTPLTGSLWVGVNANYSIAGPDLNSQYAAFSVFWDHTQSDAWTTSVNGEQSVRMSLADLLGGGASSSADCCSSGGTITGSLEGLGPYGWQAAQPCVADGCSTSLLLNLVDIKYQDLVSTAILSFDGIDARGVVFQGTMNDPYSGYSTSTYLVKPVPLPPTAFLMASGALGIAALTRRRKPG